MSPKLKTTTFAFLLAGCASQRPISDQIYSALAGLQHVDDDHTAYPDAAIEASFGKSPPDTLLVLIGGHNSCLPGPQSQDMAKPFFAMRRALWRRGVSTSFLISCYGNLSYEAYTQRSHDLNRTVQIDNEGLVRLVVEEARQTTTKRVAIVGHSYGGWLALNAALALPADIKLVSLTTIDPISQKSCVKHTLGVRAVSTILGDDANPGCQRFPDDIGPQDRQRLAASTAWRNYFQKRTALLRSGPVRDAASNILVDASHSDICLEPAIWQRAENDIVADKIPIDPRANEEPLTPADVDAWVKADQAAHPVNSLGELSARVFSRYAKSEFSLYPHGGDRTVTTYQPNSRPSLGLAVQFTPNHGFAVARSLDFLRTHDDKVRTRVAQYDYRYTRRRWVFDAFYHDYRGLIRTEGSANDVRPFRDSLFQALPPGGNRPEMRLRAFGVGGAWLLNPAAVSLPAMLTQTERHAANDWTLVVESSYRQTAVTGGTDTGVTSFRLHVISILPGFAGALRLGDYFASGTAVWGPAYRLIDGQKGDAFAENGGIRLAVGRNSQDWFGGVTGQLRLTSGPAQSFDGLGLNDKYSLVELYAGRHL